jgi:hypothetical protein
MIGMVLIGFVSIVAIGLLGVARRLLLPRKGDRGWLLGNLTLYVSGGFLMFLPPLLLVWSLFREVGESNYWKLVGGLPLVLVGFAAIQLARKRSDRRSG